MTHSRELPAPAVIDIEARHLNELLALRLLRERDLDAALARIRAAYVREILAGILPEAVIVADQAAPLLDDEVAP